jgi:phenylacetate-CoA ligase
MTYPMTLREVVEFIMGGGAPRVTFSTFISTGETLDEDTRRIVADVFGCRVVDLYAAREIGPIAFQCPDAPGYHQCFESVLCELVDNDGKPVPAGEFGRVVVTALHNYAMPFIRYDIGDYAQASPTPCRCGRTLPYLSAIGGRARNFFIMPDGSRRRLRGLMLRDLEKLLDYRQIQFVQTATDALTVRYIPLPEGRAPEHDEITNLLRGTFHDELNVRLEPVDQIERSAGFKLEQLISLVPGK